MATTPTFSTNTGLSVIPEIDQKQYPTIWNDLMRVRNAINILQQAIDAPGNVPAGGAVGEVLTKTGAGDYAIGWSPVPVVPATGVPSAVIVIGAGTNINDATTADGYTYGQVVRALRDSGLLP